MKAESLYLFIFVLCIFTLQQCKPDDPCEGLDLSNQNTYYYFPDSTKMQNGMLATPFDTLTFVSETFDTAIYLLNKINNSFDQTSKRKYSNPGCPGSIIDNYEYYELEYKDNRFNKSAKFIIKYRASITTVLLPVVDLYYEENFSKKRIGGTVLAYNEPIFDTNLIVNNNPIVAQKFGTLSDPDFFGVYNKMLGFIIYKNKNKIWRRVF